MAYVETSYQSWFGRIGNAIVGVLFGLILVPVSFIVLFWNEGRAVHTARTLEEGKSAVVSVEAGKVDPAHDGKLIHFTGQAIPAAGGKLDDSVFHVSADAIHLRRKVLMYLWKEEKHTEKHNNAIGGGTSETTTYNYSKIWSNDPIDSTNFKEAGHTNPSRWRIESHTIDAPAVTAGAFTLNRELVSRIDDFTPVTVSTDTINSLSDDLKGDARYADNAIYLSNETGRKPDPNSPQVGDLKIAFEAALPGDVSVIAKQTGSNLEPYQTKNNALQLLYIGSHSAEEMFKSEQVRNGRITWILRGCGFLAMWIGLALILSPLRVLTSVIGIVGDLVGAGIGLVTGIIAVAGSFVTIAIAWIAYRPVIGVGLLIVAGCAIALLLVMRSKAAMLRKGVVTGQLVSR